MVQTDVEKVRGNYFIWHNDEYVVLCGRILHVFRWDGTLCVQRKDLKNVHKVVFLPNNLLLADCGPQKSYILLSLKTGEEVWRIPHPKLDLTFDKFTVSPDYRYVYDLYYLKEQSYLVTIDLKKNNFNTYLLERGLRSICDLRCDENGVPCLLENHYEMIAGKHVSINGIRYEPEETIVSGSAYYWMNKWIFDFPRISYCFFENVSSILTNDLLVYNHQNNTSYYLLENDLSWELPGRRPSGCWREKSNQYVVLMYKNENIVVDCNTRKVVARYFTNYTKGSIIGDEFWVSSEKGVLRKKFPVIENISGHGDSSVVPTLPSN